MSSIIQVTATLVVEDDLVDPDHEGGLTETGFLQIQRMLAGFDDVQTELVGDAEPEPVRPRKARKI
jgi:hypothetical protein